MADPRTFELDDIVNRPGTYFNPQTDVVLIVDDTPDVDTEIFDMEDFEGSDWVLIADEAPVDEARRDELIERFQVTQRPTGTAEPGSEGIVPDQDEPEGPRELEPEEL